jgi:hypothetical protein
VQPAIFNIKEGFFKQPNFESFLQHTLVSQQVFHLVMIITYHCLLFQLRWLNPFPGINSILIVDNCTIYQGGNVQCLCDRHGVQLVYVDTCFNREVVRDLGKMKVDKLPMVVGTS